MDLLKSKVKLASSFAFYSAGLGSLFLIDAFVSKMGSVDDISLWAFLRASVMLAGFVILLGCDQALIRNFDKIGGKIVFTMLAIVLFLSLPASYVLSSIREDVSFGSVLMFVLAVALSLIVASYYRGLFRVILSQYITNNWKWLLLVAILFFYAEYEEVKILPALMIASGVVVLVNAVLLIKICYGYKVRAVEPLSLRLFYLDGLRFLLMGSTLNLSVNLEQVLLNQTGAAIEGAYLFSYITAFGAVFIVANGFYGFLLGPFAKKHKELILQNYSRFLLANVAICVVMLIFASIVGVALYGYLYDGKFVLRQELVVLVLLVFALRFIYIIPSALIGFVGGVNIFNNYLVVNVISLGLFVLSFFVLIYLSGDGVLSILLASLMNWVVRVFVGLHLIQKNLVAGKL